MTAGTGWNGVPVNGSKSRGTVRSMILKPIHMTNRQYASTIYLVSSLRRSSKLTQATSARFPKWWSRERYTVTISQYTIPNTWKPIGRPKSTASKNLPRNCDVDYTALASVLANGTVRVRLQIMRYRSTTSKTV